MYVLKGQGLFGGPDKWLESGPHHTLVLGPGDHVEIKNEVLIVLCYVHCCDYTHLDFNFQSDEQLHFVLISGEPLKEKVFQHG